MSKIKTRPQIVQRAEKEAITIMRWAKSCETEAQFKNVSNFAKKHKFLVNIAYAKEIEYYIGALDGFILAMERTKTW